MGVTFRGLSSTSLLLHRFGVLRCLEAEAAPEAQIEKEKEAANLRMFGMANETMMHEETAI
jgi:hypothetical protein